MKTLLLVAGGRGGSDFFRSLFDGHSQVLTFPGYLRINLLDKDQEITAEYQFIASKSKQILWSNSKKGEGIRK